MVSIRSLRCLACLPILRLGLDDDPLCTSANVPPADHQVSSSSCRRAVLGGTMRLGSDRVNWGGCQRKVGVERGMMIG